MKKESKSGRTESIVVRVTPEEKKMIEEFARKEGYGVSESLRGAAIMDMALNGNVEAMKIVFSAVGKNLREKFDLRHASRKEKSA